MEGWTTVSEVTIRNTRSSEHQKGWGVASTWEPSTWIRKGHADPGMWISSFQAKLPSPNTLGLGVGGSAVIAHNPEALL